MTQNNYLLKDETEKTSAQICGLVVAVALCVLLGVSLATIYFIDTHRQAGMVLQDKINPNYACQASLVRLPNIGPSRAEAIIAYRKNFQNINSDSAVFKGPEQLQRVKGIGPKTVNGLAPLLVFEKSGSSNNERQN